MADNFQVNAGVGTPVATKFDSQGVHHAKQVLEYGTATDPVIVTKTTPLPGAVFDPVTGNAAAIQQFHNADNQNPGGTAYGLLTGGVAQLLNAAGNLDRQRETGTDGIPALGIATGAAQFAMQFKTSDSTDNVAAGTRTFTPVAMSGTVQGVPWSIQLGSVLVLDSGANQETVVVTAVTGTTFTCVTAKAHNGTVTAFPITGFVYNQERDASGELDGASGAGSAVAVGYEHLSAGAPGGVNYDRDRNLQGKGVTSSTLNATGMASATGITSIAFTAVTNLQPGVPVYFEPGTANQEVLYVALDYQPGTLTVKFQTGNTINHANGAAVQWDTYAVLGPQLSGFLPTGVGIEEECLYDPVSKLYYVERSATQDAMPAANIVAESPALWNGATMDRWKGTGGSGNVAITAQVAGGALPFFNDAIAGVVTQVKATAGNLYILDLLNTTAATAYLQVFFKPAASVTLGTTVPDMVIRLTANQAKTLQLPVPTGSTGTGLSLAGTTTAGGNVAAAVSVAALFI